MRARRSSRSAPRPSAARARHGLVGLDDDVPVRLFTQLEALQPRDTRTDEVFAPAMRCLPATTKIYRATQQAARTQVRRVIACRIARPSAS